MYYLCLLSFYYRGLQCLLPRVIGVPNPRVILDYQPLLTEFIEELIEKDSVENLEVLLILRGTKAELWSAIDKLLSIPLSKVEFLDFDFSCAEPCIPKMRGPLDYWECGSGKTTLLVRVVDETGNKIQREIFTPAIVFTQATEDVTDTVFRLIA